MGLIPLQLRGLSVTLTKSPRPSPDIRFALQSDAYPTHSWLLSAAQWRGLAEGEKVARLRKHKRPVVNNVSANLKLLIPLLQT